MSDANKKVEKMQEGNENEADAPKNDNEHQRKINVGNLPNDITEQQLRDHFSEFEIERVDIFHYRKYTLALVLFKDKDTAAKALPEKDHSVLRGRRLRMHMEYMTIRHIKRDVIATVLDNENVTEDQLWDKIKAAGVEVTSVLVFYPLGYVALAKDADKVAILEQLNNAGINAHDVNQRDQNQHLDIWRAAKLFFRNRNRVQLLNIPTKWIEDKEEMKKQCAEGGVITEAVSNNVNQSASNYARVFYETEEQAIKAAAALNGRMVEGKRIHALHLGSALIPNYKTSVYVTSLEKTATEEMVYDHFKQFGEIDFVNRRNCNDAAIVCFKNAASVEKALACVTFPTPTEENKDATSEISVKKYDGPIVLRSLALKRKLKTNEDGTPIDPEEKTKEMNDVLKKLQAYHPVFVGNVPLNCPPLELKRYFAQHGPIKFMFSPQIVTYQQSAPHPVKTFIIYYNFRPSALNAVKFLDHKFFGGHRLHVLPLRGELYFDVKKTVKITKIPYLSEDALFKKVKPYVGKINRIVKKSRSSAYVELNDLADVDKFMDVDAADHPLPKGKMEPITANTSVRLYDENDTRVLRGIAKIIAKNPDMLKRVAPNQMNKRPRLNNGPGFNQGPVGFNPNNNNMNNPQAIQDLLRLAFMSGKNVGESLASNQSSFNAPDPPLANSGNFGEGGFGNNNRNNNRANNNGGAGGQNTFRAQGGQGNRNPNQGGGQNRQNFGGNAGGGNNNNFQNNAQNRNNAGAQNQNRTAGANQNTTAPNRVNQQQNKPNNTQQGGGGNAQNRLNQNQGQGNQGGNQGNQGNRRQNNFNDDGSNFGGNSNNNFNRNFGSNDNFSNDSVGNNSNSSFDNNFSNNGGGGRNFNRNQNQNSDFSSFGGGNSNNNRFNNQDNFNNRNQNRFDNDNDNNGGGGGFGGNQQKNFGQQNRQNKQFGGNNQGGGGGSGMSFGEFNSNTNRGFGNNSGFNSNSGNNGGNKWNNNAGGGQSNSGGRLAGTIFSRRF